MPSGTEELARRRRAEWNDWWLRAVALIGVLWGMLMITGITGWFSTYGLCSAAMPPAIFSPSLYKIGYDLLAGNISFLAATTWASVALACNLTILTKFLKSDIAPVEAEHRAHAVLRMTVSVITICAAMTAITVRAAVKSRADVSAACTTCVIALPAVAIGISALDRLADLARQPTSALQASMQRRGLLTTWRGVLDSCRVHRPLERHACGNDRAVAKLLNRRITNNARGV